MIKKDDEIKHYLETLNRRELQNLAKQLHIKADRKSTQIIHEMLQFCKEKLQTSQKTATSFFNDLLFTNKTQNTSAGDKTIEGTHAKVPDSMLCYENKAFENRRSVSSLKEDKGSNEVTKAFQKGKTSGIWLGKMYQKLDDLQEQWSEYLKNSNLRSRRDRAKLRTNPTSKTEDNQSTKPVPRVKKASKKQEKSKPKRKSSQVPLNQSSITITKHKKPKPTKK